MTSRIAVLALFLVGPAAGYAIQPAARKESEPSAQEHTLGWMQTSCGEWPSSGAVVSAAGHGFESKCSSGATTDTMPTGDNELVTRRACAAWCEATHPPSDGTKSWCCQLSAEPNGDVCTWSNGESTFYPIEATAAHTQSTVYTACATDNNPHALGSSHGYTESVCPPEKMQDAMKMNGDGKPQQPAPRVILFDTILMTSWRLCRAPAFVMLTFDVAAVAHRSWPLFPGLPPALPVWHRQTARRHLGQVQRQGVHAL
jgi:hypothetical protein